MCASLLSHAARAQDMTKNFSSDSALLEHLDALTMRSDILPHEGLSLFEHYIQVSLKNDWKRSLLSSQTSKLEYLAILEDPSLSLEMINEVKQRAKTLKQTSLVIRLELIELIRLTSQASSDETKAKQQSLLEKALSVEDPKLRASIFSGVGQSQAIRSDFGHAYDSLTQAYKLHDESNNLYGLAEVLNALADVNLSMNNNAEAVKYFNQALDVARQLDDQFAISVILYNIGNAYYEDERYADAKTQFQAALQLSIDLEDVTGIAYAQYAMADILLAEERFEEATVFYKTSLDRFEEIANLRMQISTLFGLSKIYLNLKDLENARASIEQSSIIQSELDTPSNLIQYQNLLAQLYALEGNFEGAYKLAKDNEVLTKALYEKNQQQEVQKFRLQFESELTEQQNEALRFQNKVKTLTIEQQDKQTKIWLLAIILIAVILIFTIILLVWKIKNGKRFQKLAHIDPLTSSPNRRDILQHAQIAFNRAKQHKTAGLTIALVDLDKFKRLNDGFGHSTGDNVLKAFAAVCKENIRDYDKFGRYGGEEWLFLFRQHDQHNIFSIFERLRDSLNEQTIDGLPSDYLATFSMGVATYRVGEDNTLQNIINRADKNLYLAKDQGRNQVVFE